MTKVIKFYASWCGPCKIYGKTWSKVSEELNSNAEFIEVDIDKDTEGLAAKYRVQSIPTTIILKEEEIIKEVGLVKETKLKELILN
jgi:thioredoxin 1